jgi:hypothetical protein
MSNICYRGLFGISVVEYVMLYYVVVLQEICRLVVLHFSFLSNGNMLHWPLQKISIKDN